MKKSKKMLSAAVVFSMTAALLSSLAATKAEAATFSTTAVAQYDFESGTGMSTTSKGTAPTVVNDAERGNVLQFADGTTSKIINHDDDPSIEERSWTIVEGSPSSLKFANPFKGRSLTGATISFWVKLPSEEAGDVVDDETDNGPGVSNGIVGFVDSEFRTMVHPDCKDGGHSDIVERGSRTFFGISAKPAAYFSQIHHNWLWAVDTDATLSYNIGTWQYCAVSITNETMKWYINGKALNSNEIQMGKRFYKNPVYESPGNEGMPFLLDFLCDNMSYTFGGKAGTVTLIDKNSKKSVEYGHVPSNVECWVGFTGFSPTYAGTCIDDLTFFTEAFSDAKMAELYEAAKTPGGISVDSGRKKTGGNEEPAKEFSAEEASAIADSTQLLSAPEGVSIGAPTVILKNDAATSEIYNSIKAALDSAIPGLIASNSEWSGLQMSKDDIYMMDIPLTGRELAEGETATIEMNNPYKDTDTIWILRVDDDGTVTKCDIASIADGRIQFITNKLCKFAVVRMTTALPKTGVMDTAYFLILGGALLAGGLVLVRRRKTA